MDNGLVQVAAKWEEADKKKKRNNNNSSNGNSERQYQGPDLGPQRSMGLVPMVPARYKSNSSASWLAASRQKSIGAATAAAAARLALGRADWRR